MESQKGTIIKLDPAKCRRGLVWDEKDRTEIAEIYISHGYRIISLQFLYVENGTLVLSKKYGGPSSENFDVIKFDYPTEFLTWMKFEYEDGARPHDVVCGISFGTNKGTYGPFGYVHKLNSKFNYQVGPGRSFAGFHGSATDGYLESIGLYVRPTTQLVSNINNNAVVKKEKVED